MNLSEAERRTLAVAVTFSALTVFAAYLYVKSQAKRYENTSSKPERFRRAASTAKKPAQLDGDNVPRFDSSMVRSKSTNPSPLLPPHVTTRPGLADVCGPSAQPRTLVWTWNTLRQPLCRLSPCRRACRDGCDGIAPLQRPRRARPWASFRSTPTSLPARATAARTYGKVQHVSCHTAQRGSFIAICSAHDSCSDFQSGHL